MSDKMLSFGWGAPSFAEQLPELTPQAAEKANAFNKAITLLSLHGIITEAERDRAIKRATREIGSDLRKALTAARREDPRPATSNTPET